MVREENAKDLEFLINTARTVALTNEEKEQQRRSFAYGNANIENSRVTREMVDRQAEELKKLSNGSGFEERTHYS